jgi:UDP-N-acetylmuramate--alanine ligase
VKYFFVGIGGIGMSALAELLKAQGHQVRGSDVVFSKTVERLIQKGISVQIGHEIPSVFNDPSEILVINSAIAFHNPILLVAQKLGCKILKRGELLADFVNAHQGLVVAGSHGKTTTSSMLVHVLKKIGEKTGRSPSFAIGGRLQGSADNAGLGHGSEIQKLFVAEGDESDASFLKLRPRVLAVTNIDADHMSTYGHSFDALIQAFVEWILNLPEQGVAVLNQDDAGVLAVLEAIEKINPIFWNTRKLILISKKRPLSKVLNLISLDGISQQPFDIKVNFNISPEGFSYSALWPLIGEFNVINALMAGAMADAVGVSWPEIIEALSSYPGVERRMQYLGNLQGVHFFEDYGHHPAEIRASLKGLKAAYPNSQLIQVFQPHRYTRTRDLWGEFIEVLGVADHLILLPIYPASEAEIPGVNSQKLFEEIKASRFKDIQNTQNYYFSESLKAALNQLNLLLKTLSPGDLVVLQGAGDIPQKIGRELI